MRTIYSLTFLLSSFLTITLQPANAAKVICEKFEFTAEVTGKKSPVLSYQLTETDLPNNTDVTISVSKTYYVNNNMEAYPINYYVKHAKVSEIQQKVTVDIDLQQDRKQIQRSRKIKAGFGQPFEVKKIDDTINFEILVPLQKDSKFGKSNRNLSGKMVKKAEYLGFPIIKVNKILSISEKTSANTLVGKSNPSLSPRNLTIGSRYKLSKRTPIWEKTTEDTIASLQPASVIKILSKSGSTTPEYKVETMRQDGTKSRGWVSSTALWGQDLEVVK